MSSEDLRLEEVPSIDDLERIEAYTDSENQVDRTFQNFVQGELLERFVENDDRYDETTHTLSGEEFDYGDIRGS